MFAGQRRYGRDPTKVVRASPYTWRAPFRWQKKAQALGVTWKVFTCSWSDWFHEAADPWRAEAWQVVRACRNLTFIILTKRSERIADHLPADWGDGYPSVWLGVSIENNDYAYRADHLRAVPALVRPVSYEPVLGPLDALDLTGLDWLMVGGESGPDYRKMELQWVRDQRDRCRAAGVPFFFKQGNGIRSEMNIELDGEIIRQYPTPRRVPLPLFD
jgi:protein gp37